MCPVEALLLHRVNIVLLIGVLVMMAMMCCPPKGTLLSRHAAEKGQNELKPPGGLERAMRKVAMISPGDAEFTNQKQSHEEQDAGQIGFDKES
jgi:hypothetical protein